MTLSYTLQYLALNWSWPCLTPYSS